MSSASLYLLYAAYKSCMKPSWNAIGIENSVEDIQDISIPLSFSHSLLSLSVLQTRQSSKTRPL
jgi:hypothetical protein